MSERRGHDEGVAERERLYKTAIVNNLRAIIGESRDDGKLDVVDNAGEDKLYVPIKMSGEYFGSETDINIRTHFLRDEEGIMRADAFVISLHNRGSKQLDNIRLLAEVTELSHDSQFAAVNTFGGVEPHHVALGLQEAMRKDFDK